MLTRLLTIATHKIHSLPILILMPHSSCNCRCVMCDIWKANQNKKEISYQLLNKHIETFRKLRVREVVLSGGEALMYRDLWKLCTALKDIGIKITLLTTGLLIERYADEIIGNIDNLIISIDGSEAVHDRIRNVPGGFARISAGIDKIKFVREDFPIHGRCVLQRYNYADFPNIIRSAREIRMKSISFLPADVSTGAFNRPLLWGEERISEVALSSEETLEMEKIIERSFEEFASEYNQGFILESPHKMRRIVQYYKAINGGADFPKTNCNAPWVSAVVESDGNILPCFFHKPYGSLSDRNFTDIINSDEAIRWRKALDVNNDPVCQKCVCTLKLGLNQRT